jgi:crossover junction endodeoxyribonuclease RuvC
MRIIGLDPGLQHTGWGIIDQDGSRLSFVAAGRISSVASRPWPSAWSRSTPAWLR